MNKNVTKVLFALSVAAACSSSSLFCMDEKGSLFMPRLEGKSSNTNTIKASEVTENNIGKLKKLRKLVIDVRIEDSSATNLHVISKTDNINWSLINSLTGLEELTLKGDSFFPVDCMDFGLSRFKNLKKLSIEGCLCCVDSSDREFFTSIRDLTLGFPVKSEKFNISDLLKDSNVEKLTLGYCKVDLNVVLQLKKLKTVRFEGVTFENVNLGEIGQFVSKDIYKASFIYCNGIGFESVKGILPNLDVVYKRAIGESFDKCSIMMVDKGVVYVESVKEQNKEGCIVSDDNGKIAMINHKSPNIMKVPFKFQNIERLVEEGWLMVCESLYSSFERIYIIRRCFEDKKETVMVKGPFEYVSEDQLKDYVLKGWVVVYKREFARKSIRSLKAKELIRKAYPQMEKSKHRLLQKALYTMEGDKRIEFEETICRMEDDDKIKKFLDDFLKKISNQS